jgi:hypothetical protein
MKSSIKSPLTVLILFLSACGPVVAPKPTEIPRTLIGNTQTYTPTKTIAPTITNTPTEPITPTETAIPVPKHTEGVAGSYDETIVVNEEDKLSIMANIMAHPALSFEVATPVPNRIQPQKRVGENDVLILGKYGVNCIIRATLRVINPNGGLDMIEFIYELREPDGTHIYIIGYFGGQCSNPDNICFPKYYINQWLQEIQGVTNGQYFDIYITIRFNIPENEVNPAAWSLANAAPNENQKILQALWESDKSGKLPKELSTITVFGNPWIER